MPGIFLISQSCACGKSFDVNHAMICPKATATLTLVSRPAPSCSVAHLMDLSIPLYLVIMTSLHYVMQQTHSDVLGMQPEEVGHASRAPQ